MLAPPLTKLSSDSCDIYRDVYSGNTRGIVANSGSNSVSILDLINDDVLATIAVGKDPVAIVISSDGATAYVANLGDSTVSVIDLQSMSATATISVGGQPSSLAINSTGTLWVGGNGFLDQIDTATLTISASESTGESNIIGLGYSDGVGKLLATTVDPNGDVYADQISPSSVTPGGQFSPAYSDLVSSLGLYQNSTTQKFVHAYTATMANSLTQNVNQIGTGPLAVQDGWAVITATPTGFTITDITGNLTLATVKTASPVTGIALDKNLNVAYIVMPDSDIVLTVPLPGIGTGAKGWPQGYVTTN